MIRTAVSPDGYVMLDEVMKERGGCEGLICENIYKPKSNNHLKCVSFKIAEYKILVRNIPIIVIIIYRPPYSVNNPYT